MSEKPSSAGGVTSKKEAARLGITISKINYV
jgi:hypothetical protein